MNITRRASALTPRATPVYDAPMSTVRVEEREGGVRVLTLDHPPANAENEELLADLGTALAAARTSDGVRAVVLTGAGKFFSGGFDLSAPRRDDDSGHLFRDLFRDTHLALLALPKPTVAMVNGHAIAGGLVLALACDYRLGVEGGYRIGLNEVAIGASYPRVAFEIGPKPVTCWPPGFFATPTALMFRCSLCRAAEYLSPWKSPRPSTLLSTCSSSASSACPAMRSSRWAPSPPAGSRS